MPVAPDQDFLPVIDQSLVEQRASTRYNNTVKGGPTSSWVASYSRQTQIQAPEPGSPVDLGAPTAQAVTAATALVTAPTQIIAPGVTYDSTIVADTPVGFWPLNETSGTTATDASGNGHAGTYTGGFTLNQAGIGDGEGSVLLNGSTGYVNCGNPAALSLGDGPLTCEGWVKPAATGQIDNVISHGNLSFALRLGGDAVQWLWSCTALIAQSPVTVPDTNWHYLAATKSGASNHIYLDGVDVTGTVSNAVLSSPAQVVVLGCEIDGSSALSFLLSGLLAKCAVYNSVLSATQVAAHYSRASTSGATVGPVAATAATAAVTAPAQLIVPGVTYASTIQADSPVAYYRLGETSGAAIDQMGGPNGTLSGSATQGTPSLLPSGDGASINLAGGSIAIPDTVPTELGAGDYTVEVWQTAHTTTAFMAIIDTVNRALGLYWGSFSTMYVCAGNGQTNAVGGTSGGIAATDVVDHFIYIIQGTNFYIGKNGVVTGPDTIAHSTTPASGFGIGANLSGVNSWQGKLQEFALYNYALTSTQVAAHYSRGSTGGTTTGPVGATQATATVAVPGPSLVATATAVSATTVTLTAAANLTATATAVTLGAASTQAPALLTATAQCVAAATLAGSAPAALTATAQALTLASAATTARAAITPTATAVAQATAATTASAVLAPSAQAVTLAQGVAQTTAPITATATAVAQATATVTAVGPQAITATAQAVNQATATTTAPARLAATAQAASSTTATATANAQLAPAAATAVTQAAATVAATATPQLTPTATATSQAQTLLTASATLTPTAQATTAATAQATTTAGLAATAVGVSQATAITTVRALLTATATTTTQAQTHVTAAYVTTHAWPTIAADQILNSTSAGDQQLEPTTQADTIRTLVYAGEE